MLGITSLFGSIFSYLSWQFHVVARRHDEFSFPNEFEIYLFLLSISPIILSFHIRSKRGIDLKNYKLGKIIHYISTIYLSMITIVVFGACFIFLWFIILDKSFKFNDKDFLINSMILALVSLIFSISVLVMRYIFTNFKFDHK